MALHWSILKYRRCLITIICFNVLALCVYSLLGRLHRHQLQNEECDPLVIWPNASSSPLKTILLWNSPHRIETSSFGIGGPDLFSRHGCQVTQCQIVTKRRSLPFELYDAVVFHMHEIEVTKLPEEEGYRRRHHQRYVFLTQESPLSMVTVAPSSYPNYFNWTMSYKRNSDIDFFYGRVRPRATAPKDRQQVDELIRQTHNWTRDLSAGKSRSVAWMVSHCQTPSQRENYVRELSKHIDVDVYGACGNLACSRNAVHWLSEPHCYDMLAGRYLFYLSFENSLCQDYVTEKFFEILRHNLVPVVYGAADYESLAPAHSFIDARQATPSQLARELKRIASNRTLYNEFFWWKDHYDVEAGVDQMSSHGFCDLCSKLHNDTTRKVYEELETEWNATLQCQIKPTMVTPTPAHGFFQTKHTVGYVVVAICLLTFTLVCFCDFARVNRHNNAKKCQI